MTENPALGLQSLLAPFASIANSLDEQNQIMAKQNRLLQDQVDLLKKMHWEANRSRLIQESFRATFAAPLMDSIQEFYANHQLGLLDTLRVLREQRLNLARFGDGELRLMLRLDYNLQFQRNSPALQGALLNVIDVAKSHPTKLLVGLPHTYRDYFWGGIFGEIWGQLFPLIEDIPVFANSHISRPHMFGVHGEDAVAAWRTIWDNLDVAIVTGKGSRFDLTPELFDNTKSTRYEYSIASGAFSDVPRMVDILKSGPADVILLSLGPAGTIIAAELALHGVWALDIGHLSKSYEFEFKNGNFPEATPHVRQMTV